MLKRFLACKKSKGKLELKTLIFDCFYFLDILTYRLLYYLYVKLRDL